MNTTRIPTLLASLIAAALVLAACGGGGPAPQEVTLQGQDIKYDKTALTAQVGQTVNVTLENTGALEHSFLIDEFNVKITGIQPGQKGTGSFTPSSAGTYTYYCDVAGHREAGMVGTLTVNP